jgi:hypothetical protein
MQAENIVKDLPSSSSTGLLDTSNLVEEALTSVLQRGHIYNIPKLVMSSYRVPIGSPARRS